MDIHLINRKLRDDFGTDWLGQPYYKIVWSDDELEKRFADFVDYLPGTNILLRRVREVREVKKYSFLEPQYILEKLFHNQHNTEILDNNTLAPSQFTYEPLWVFGFDNGKPRRPVWRAVELLIHWHLNPPKMKSPAELQDMAIEKAAEDERIMMELLNEHIPNDSLHMAIKDGGAVMLNDANREDGKK